MKNHNPNNILAITNEAQYVPLVMRNPLSSLVTALPYIDEENDNEMNVQINGLIEEEMRRNYKSKNYLEPLPPPKLNYIDSEAFNVEIDRIKNDKDSMINLMKRYELDDLIPLEKSNDPSTWRKLLDHISTLFQYNTMKLFNLELMLKYGPEVWRKYVEDSEKIVKKVESLNEKLRFEVNELNANRKYEQYETGEKIDNIKKKLIHIHSKNQLLEEECEKLENEIANIRRKKLKIK